MGNFTRDDSNNPAIGGKSTTTGNPITFHVKPVGSPVVNTMPVAIIDGNGNHITFFGNLSVGATGSAVPVDANYTGVNVDGNLAGLSGKSLGLNTALDGVIVDKNGTQINSLPGALDVNVKAVSPFVTTNGPSFNLKGQPFKYVSFNYYPLIMQNSQSDVQKQLDDFKNLGATVVRTWCFDGPISFRSFIYPLGTNLISNSSFETNTTGYTLDAAFTRSNDTAEDGSWSIKQVSDYNAYDFLKLNGITVLANTDYVFTFWYELTHFAGSGSQLPPRINVGSTAGDNDIANGGTLDSSAVWIQHQFKFNSGNHTTIYLSIENFGGKNNAYYDNFNLCLAQTPTLQYNESALVNLDMVLDEARKRDIRLILSLADGNYSNYNTKGMYVDWANTLNGTSLDNGQHSTDFYTSPLVDDIYMDFIKVLSQRKNTINGRQYKDDPNIFSIELGNELRGEAFDPGNVVNTRNAPNYLILSAPGGWTDKMSTYVKTWFPNHMCNFGDMGHCADYLQDGSGVGDAVYNGTYDGISYLDAIKLPYISFMDFHIYPTQNDGIHLAASSGKYWGQKFGYNNGASGDGFRAQLADYVKVAHANNKPCVCTETGEDVSQTADNSLYPLQNRYNYFKNFLKDFMDIAGGDGVNIWHSQASATVTIVVGNFNVALEATGGAGVTDNSNDTDIVNLVKTYNNGFLNNITPAQTVISLIKTNGDIITKNINPGDSTISVQLSDTWTGTVQFESTIDGINWYSINLTDLAGNPVNSTTANDIFTGSIAGMNKFRIRASATITGSLTVNIQSSSAVAGSSLVPQYAPISASSNGDNTIIAAVTGKRIRVLNGLLIASAAVNIYFRDNTAGTAVSGTLNLAVNGGFQIPYSPIGNFQTSSGNPLVLNLSGAIPVGGWLSYITL